MGAFLLDYVDNKERLVKFYENLYFQQLKHYNEIKE